MKQTLNVKLKNDKSIEYKIFINDNKFSVLKEDLDVLTCNKKRLIVFSEKVYKLYKDKFCFNNKEIIVLKDGEAEKNFKNYVKILEKLVELNLTREDFIIAFGGGVVGDITGFVASTYMRGIKYVQVPTTLLAMVDSSVGGKTAIDMKNGKNMVGSFYQPFAVFININFLKTLDEKQYRSGLGEIIKYAFIEKSCGHDQNLFFFEHLTLCCEKLLEREPMTIARVIEYCLNMKIAVVTQDEKENGLRKILNLGHTLAHALEVKGNYKKFTHGEAVIYGIYFIFAWAYSKSMISYSYYRMSCDLLEKYGFETLDLSKFSSKELVELMKSDKKATGDKITFVVPSEKKTVKEIKLSPEEAIEMFV